MAESSGPATVSATAASSTALLTRLPPVALDPLRAASGAGGVASPAAHRERPGRPRLVQLLMTEEEVTAVESDAAHGAGVLYGSPVVKAVARQGTLAAKGLAAFVAVEGGHRWWTRTDVMCR